MTDANDVTPVKGKEVPSRTDPELIDAELASQLSDVIDAIEAVRWSDVPDIDPSTASRFNRQLIESRSTLLTPRVITDGGQVGLEDDPPGIVSDFFSEYRGLWFSETAIAVNTSLELEAVRDGLQELLEEDFAERRDDGMFRWAHPSGLTHEELDEVHHVADELVYPAFQALTAQELDVDGAIKDLDEAIRRLAVVSRTHETTESGGPILYLEEPDEN